MYISFLNLAPNFDHLRSSRFPRIKPPGSDQALWDLFPPESSKPRKRFTSGVIFPESRGGARQSLDDNRNQPFYPVTVDRKCPSWLASRFRDFPKATCYQSLFPEKCQKYQTINRKNPPSAEKKKLKSVMAFPSICRVLQLYRDNRLVDRASQNC